MASDENRVENFRQVTAATMRAIAENEEIQLTFGSESRLVGTNARLPAPPRDMKDEDVAHLRSNQSNPNQVSSCLQQYAGCGTSGDRQIRARPILLKKLLLPVPLPDEPSCLRTSTGAG